MSSVLSVLKISRKATTLQALNVVTNTMKNALKTGWRAGIYRAQPAGQGQNGIRRPADSLKLFLVNLPSKTPSPISHRISELNDVEPDRKRQNAALCDS